MADNEKLSDELKPCPFCGSKPTAQWGEFTAIYCMCDLSPTTGGLSLREEAIATWNGRASDVSREWISVKNIALQEGAFYAIRKVDSQNREEFVVRQYHEKVGWWHGQDIVVTHALYLGELPKETP